jgi:hypothetical protein
VIPEALTAMPHALTYVEVDDQRTVRAPGIRLTFARPGERWLHELALDDGSEPAPTVIARSVESDIEPVDRSRVISPTYQELQEHPLDEGVRVLLTGQSTPHHFSAVVTARWDGKSASIVFDVADRCRTPIEALAATYLVPLGSSALVDASPDRLLWGGELLGGGSLEFAAASPNTVSLAEAGRRACRVQALAHLRAGDATQRLVYQWNWTPACR